MRENKVFLSVCQFHVVPLILEHWRNSECYWIYDWTGGWCIPVQCKYNDWLSMDFEYCSNLSYYILVLVYLRKSGPANMVEAYYFNLPLGVSKHG